LWVSEYRIESGLNCGGHAFASDGYLMGPILAEFKKNRNLLIQSVNEILVQALTSKNRTVPETELPLKITAQGGVGTAEEHQFLIDHYQIDSVGWGSPFLLVPEATTVDEQTMFQLSDAKEDDLYLSNISPLGVPFNSLRGNTKDIEKMNLAEQGKAGSLCPKRYLSFNSEFTEKPICTASYRYQRHKLIKLESEDLIANEHQNKAEQITDKSCLCVGLGTSALLKYNLDTKVEGKGVSVCPGPNMAYFSNTMSLKEITDHIYGRANVISGTERPNMFVKELSIYTDYLKNKIEEAGFSISNKHEKYLLTFAENLNEGISYYYDLFNEMKDKFEDTKSEILTDLDTYKQKLKALHFKIKNISLVTA
jgi:hypothetical protein